MTKIVLSAAQIKKAKKVKKTENNELVVPDAPVEPKGDSAGFTLVNFDASQFEHYETYEALAADIEDLLASDLVCGTGQAWLDENILVFRGIHRPLSVKARMTAEITEPEE